MSARVLPSDQGVPGGEGMTVEISITGNPAECRNAIYQMRLMRDVFIADIYEERPGNSVQEWYCVILDGKENPC